MPEAPLPDWGESRENLRRFMEEGILELSFKGPIGIWQVKRVGNGEKDFPMQYAGVQRERIQVGEYWERSPQVWSPVCVCKSY